MTEICLRKVPMREYTYCTNEYDISFEAGWLAGWLEGTLLQNRALRPCLCLLIH